MQPTRYYPQQKLRAGTYPKLICYGSYTMLGTVRADYMSLTGTLDGQYALTAGSLRATGAIRVPTLGGNNIFFYGTSSMRGILQVNKSVTLLGCYIGDGPIVCPIVNIEGTATISGRITAAQITAKGVLSLGMLNAETIRVEFADQSHCTGLLGKKIIISRKPMPALLRLFAPVRSNQDPKFHVNSSITGEYVSLEHVTVDTVKGVDVNIGPGCHVNKVFYREHLYIDEEAYVDWYEPYDDPENTPPTAGSSSGGNVV